MKWEFGRHGRAVWIGLAGLALAGALQWRGWHAKRASRDRPPVATEDLTAAVAPSLAPATVWRVDSVLARNVFDYAPAAHSAGARATRASADSSGLAAARATAPAVQLLLLDPLRPLALVDHRRVAVGDSVGAYRVVAIDSMGVTLDRGGRRVRARP